jgi:hypothetical protein
MGFAGSLGATNRLTRFKADNSYRDRVGPARIFYA